MNRRDEARELRDRLHRAYCKPGETRPGVIFTAEVNAPESNRRADALALHLTRSRPWLDGIEIKVNRSDWLSELDDHTKSDAWFPHTSRWWVAVSDPTIVQPGELPDGWGLMAPNPRSDRLMKVLAKPTVRDPQLPYTAVMELLKKVDNMRLDQVNEQVHHAHEKLRAEFDERVKELAQRDTLDHFSQKERDIGRALADATRLSMWELQKRLADPGTIELIRAALQPGLDSRRDQQLRSELTRETQRHQKAADALHAALIALNGEQGEVA